MFAFQKATNDLIFLPILTYPSKYKLKLLIIPHQKEKLLLLLPIKYREWKTYLEEQIRKFKSMLSDCHFLLDLPVCSWLNLPNMLKKSVSIENKWLSYMPAFFILVLVWFTKPNQLYHQHNLALARYQAFPQSLLWWEYRYLCGGWGEDGTGIGSNICLSFFFFCHTLKFIPIWNGKLKYLS